MNEERTAQIHPVDEMLPTGQLFAYGLQHVLAMSAGAVAVPIIVAQALHLSPMELVLSLIHISHVVSGSIMGVGSAQRVKAVHWSVARQMVTAWVMTIPCTCLLYTSVGVKLQGSGQQGFDGFISTA